MCQITVLAAAAPGQMIARIEAELRNEFTQIRMEFRQGARPILHDDHPRLRPEQPPLYRQMKL